MVLLQHIALLLLMAGQTNALNCFGQICNVGQQYCQIQLYSHAASCYPHYGHTSIADHQLCMSMPHPGHRCFCRDQACVDEMTRHFITAAPVTQASTTAPPQTMAPTTQPLTSAPAVHIEAIPCGGSTCFTPQSCSVTFVNGMPSTASCSNTVTTHCGPFPTNGVCECDSTFCMNIINSFGTLATPLSTTPGILPTAFCKDKEDASFTCKGYNDQFAMCSASSGTLQRIAINRCSKFCGFCGTFNGTVVTQSPIVGGSSTLPPCVDHDSRCTSSVFQQIMCTATKPETRQYAIATCPKSCNLCKEYIGQTKHPSTLPQTTATTTQTTKTTTATTPTTQTASVCTESDVLVCEDKPGVDCKVLNATNFCASPFSCTYCRQYCRHCTSLSPVG